MPRRKRKRSFKIDNARTCLGGIRAISPDLDFGNGLTANQTVPSILQPLSLPLPPPTESGPSGPTFAKAALCCQI